MVNSEESGSCDGISDPILLSIFSAAPAAWVRCTQQIEAKERYGAYLAGAAAGAALGMWRMRACEEASALGDVDAIDEDEQLQLVSLMQGGICVGALGVSWWHACCSAQQAACASALCVLLGTAVIKLRRW